MHYTVSYQVGHGGVHLSFHTDAATPDDAVEKFRAEFDAPGRSEAAFLVKAVSAVTRFDPPIEI